MLSRKKCWQKDKQKKKCHPSFVLFIWHSGKHINLQVNNWSKVYKALTQKMLIWFILWNYCYFFKNPTTIIKLNSPNISSQNISQESQNKESNVCTWVWAWLLNWVVEWRRECKRVHSCHCQEKREAVLLNTLLL